MIRISQKIPFRVGGPITDPADFVGREELVQGIVDAMVRLQNVSLHGERRTGKTSLLLFLSHPDSPAELPGNHIPVYFDFQSFTNAGVSDVGQALAEAIAEQIKRRCPEQQDDAEEFLDIIKGFFVPSKEAVLFGTGFGRALAFLDEADFRIHFLFDEFDQTSRNPNLGDSFYDALRALSTRAGNISYVIATRTGLAALQPVYDKVSSPFFNIFTTRTLTPFTEDEVHRMIFDYFVRAEVDFSLAEKLCAESEFLFEVTGYHPFFVQVLCYHLCQRLDKADWPGGQAQEEALQAVEKDSEQHFEFYWKYSSKPEQELIEKLTNSQSINWEDSKHVVESLRDRCLVVQAVSGYQLFSSVFAKWAERQLYSLSQQHEIYSKLNKLDQVVLNVVAHDLGIRDYSQQKKEDIVEKILKNRDKKAVLSELKNDWNDLYLKLKSLDRIILNVVAHDLGIRDYSQQEKEELIEDVLKNRDKKAILSELYNNWNEVHFKLNSLNRNQIEIVAKKLGIRDDSHQTEIQLIENILKSAEKKTILKVLSTRWRRKIEYLYGIASLISLLFALFFYFVPPDYFKTFFNSTFTEPVTGIEFVWMSGRCYDMGCGEWAGDCYDYEKPSHKVCVDGFWIGKYEVTQGQWKKIMQDNPSAFKHGDNYPVEMLSWNDTKEFIRKLNEKTGGKFRLPTEAEWEYACRSGGKPEKYADGKDIDEVSWYASNSEISTHPIGTKAPNRLGIYDMSGNVGEWCEDMYSHDAYMKHQIDNPISKDGLGRVIRGGGWSYYSRAIRCTSRSGSPPEGRANDTGFRLVKMP